MTNPGEFRQDYGQRMEPVSSDMTSLDVSPLWRYDSSGDFLVVFIRFFFYPFNKD